MAPTSGFLPVSEGSLFWKYETSDSSGQRHKAPLLFSHAGVADHTQWDEQVEYFLKQGWDCLRFDRFGYGRSDASEEWLKSTPRQPVNHIQHMVSLIQHVLPPGSKVILVGLSMGGAYSVQFTVSHPEFVLGMAVLAGGLDGWDHPNKPEEDKLFEEADAYSKAGDVEKAAKLMVRIWGDGPLQPPGRMAQPLADRMLKWNTAITTKECAKTGGSAFEDADYQPPVLQNLDRVEVPTIVAFGTYDETNTNSAMNHLASKVKGATLKEFKAAHMINMECSSETNEWIHDWLKAHFSA